MSMIRKHEETTKVGFDFAAAQAVVRQAYPEADPVLVKLETEWELSSRKFKSQFIHNMLVGALPDYDQRVERIARSMLVKLLSQKGFYESFEGDEDHLDRLIQANLNAWVKSINKLIFMCVSTATGRANAVPIETVFGAMSEDFNYEPEMIKWFIETFIEEEENIFLNAEELYNEGEYLLISQVELDACDKQAIAQFSGQKPMLLPPQYPTMGSEGRPLAGTTPTSKGTPANPGDRKDVAYKIGQTQWFWNECVMEEFEFIYKRKFSPKEDPNQISWDESRTSWETSILMADEVYQEMKELGLRNTPMYLPTSRDGRFREYYKCSSINPQKTEYHKGMLRMRKRKLTEEGLNGLYFSIANALNPKVNGTSLDKQPISDRIAWVKSKSLEELKLLASQLERDTRYKYECDQTQYVAEEPTRAFSAIRALENAIKGDLYTGETAASDGKCQGMAIWGASFQDPQIMYLTALTSGHECPDLYTHIGNQADVPRGPSKDALKVFMYGGSSGAKADLEKIAEGTYDKFCDVLNRLPTFRAIRKIAGYWNPNWDAIRIHLPDATCTQIWPKYKDPETGEEGETLESDLFGMPVQWKVHSIGHLETSSSLAAHVNHTTDAYIQAENVRKCMFNPEQAQILMKIRDYRNFMKSSCISEDMKDFKLTQKSFNPKSKKNKELMECLYRGSEIGWYSFRILDLLDYSNQEMVSDEVLDYLYYELPEKPIELGVIHDSLICHVNDVWEVQNQYRRTFFHFANSTWYEPIFNQLGVNVRLPKRNKILNDKILHAENLFG